MALDVKLYERHQNTPKMTDLHSLRL